MLKQAIQIHIHDEWCWKFLWVAQCDHLFSSSLLTLVQWTFYSIFFNCNKCILQLSSSSSFLSPFILHLFIHSVHVFGSLITTIFPFLPLLTHLKIDSIVPLSLTVYEIEYMYTLNNIFQSSTGLWSSSSLQFPLSLFIHTKSVLQVLFFFSFSNFHSSLSCNCYC